MSFHSTNKHPLARKGTSQSERYPAALGKDYVKIDERSFEDLITQSAELSKYFNFFEKDAIIPNGNWSIFFNEIYDATTKTVKLDRIEALRTSSSLSPHLGLFLAFLRLFQISVDQLNGLTDQHLMLFYEQMLRLKRKAPIPPQVSLIGELAKDVDSLLLPQGTLFKAGKNKFGEERYFLSDQDLVLNQAKVVSLKTVNLLNAKIRQRDISNSADGLGAEILDDPRSWFAFGQEQDKLTELGFCIASPFLGINEGERKIVLTINNVELNDFYVFISVENGWEKLMLAKLANGAYTVTLNSSFPKIVPIDEKKHGIKDGNIYPFLKFVLKDSKSSTYFKYKNISSNINITIDYSDIKALAVKNELGIIDVSKPFQPFGSTPTKEYSTLSIGHPILLNKYATAIAVFQNSTSVTTNANTQYLNSGVWETGGFKMYDTKFDKEYTISTKNNYLRIKYTGNNPSAAVVQIKITELGNNTQKIEITPPTTNAVTWQNLTLSVKVGINQNNKDVFFFYHLHPFELLSQPNPSKLLPSYERMSYLFIGVEKLRYGQTLSLHFELLEGSGNQDLNHPKAKWFVKEKDQILTISSKEMIKDTTNKLMQSGLVQFALDKNRFENETDDSIVWLLAACDHNESAVPEFITVLAQAFTATYVIPESQIIEDIGAETIKKTLFLLNGLKKISQPYKSFGGRLQENTEAFVLRNSERLRHKGVAIQIFDYERLLLENFPYLYQVKCITHSTSSSHQAPGNILIIVVPKLKRDSSQIDLKPRVSIGQRETIKQFLEKITSPFVHIDVRNPDYQEIQIEVNVTYLPKYEPEKEYYNTVLNSRLQSYIAPWIDDKIGVEFNKIDYKSRYINFIEEQEFVDNIMMVNLYVNGAKVENKIESEREDVIFTSANHHIIRNGELC